ncbi:hypothetical protein FF011L_19700 [Roseimaritima multifibrata]|uniref:Uncharacterized protein n=1 Tax=Roseimaritima multifibrata TaxID=1930274 RepID=A0A517ME97_9BACT|nr:hypothetical protein FF011L_19700 [Roseimaritima multifibrata]
MHLEPLDVYANQPSDYKMRAVRTLGGLEEWT